MKIEHVIKVCNEHGINPEIRGGLLMAQTLAFSEEWSLVPLKAFELYIWLGY